MNTDYNLYKIFLYLYEERSISKTASKLFVSQPAISYSLKELEGQLGYSLFTRNSKGVEPTLEAKELYSYITRAFRLLKDGEEHIKNLSNLNTGDVRIGVSSLIGVNLLSNYIVEFHKKYPGIHIELVYRTSEELSLLLEMRKIDFFIDTINSHSKKDFSKELIKKYNTTFFYHKSFEGKVNITKLMDLSKYPLILPSIYTDVRIKIDDYFKKKNVLLNSFYETDSMDAMMEMVRRGIGIGYVLDNYIFEQKDKDDFCIISNIEDLPKIEVCCFTIKDYLTVATNKFIELMKEK